MKQKLIHELRQLSREGTKPKSSCDTHKEEKYRNSSVQKSRFGNHILICIVFTTVSFIFVQSSGGFLQIKC